MRIASDATTVEIAQKSLLEYGATANGLGAVSMLEHRYCLSPVGAELHTRTGSSAVNRSGKDRGRWTDLLLPCRKCEGCRNHQAATVRHRAETEMARASRTWLLTLTMAPEGHSHYGGLNCQPGEDVRAWTRQLQLYWKRVRKNSRAPMRYLWVLERHKSGLLHAHALLHEYGVAIRERIIEGAWTLGFTKSSLVSDSHSRVARYVVKYMTKELTACRASVRYGAEAYGREMPNPLRIAKREGPTGCAAQHPPSGGHSAEGGEGVNVGRATQRGIKN